MDKEPFSKHPFWSCIKKERDDVEKFDSIFECSDRIAKNPFSFESVDDIKTGSRRCVCGSDTIYFKITNNRVAVMAIIGKQDLKNIL